MHRQLMLVAFAGLLAAVFAFPSGFSSMSSLSSKKAPKCIAKCMNDTNNPDVEELKEMCEKLSKDDDGDKDAKLSSMLSTATNITQSLLMMPKVCVMMDVLKTCMSQCSTNASSVNAIAMSMMKPMLEVIVNSMKDTCSDIKDDYKQHEACVRANGDAAQATCEVKHGSLKDQLKSFTDDLKSSTKNPRELMRGGFAGIFGKMRPMCSAVSTMVFCWGDEVDKTCAEDKSGTYMVDMANRLQSSMINGMKKSMFGMFINMMPKECLNAYDRNPSDDDSSSSSNPFEGMQSLLNGLKSLRGKLGGSSSPFGDSGRSMFGGGDSPTDRTRTLVDKQITLADKTDAKLDKEMKKLDMEIKLLKQKMAAAQ